MILKLLCILFFPSLILHAHAQLTFFNTRQPDYQLWKLVEKNFTQNYEADNLIENINIQERVMECNPTLRKIGLNQFLKFGTINYCLDKSYLKIKFGLGYISINNAFKKGTSIELTGESVALGFELHKSLSLSSLLLFGIQYQYLPSFKNDELSTIDDIRLSSVYDFYFVLQNRIENSPLSTRLGMSYGGLPIIIDESTSLNAFDLDLQNEALAHFAAIAGFKITDSRKRGGKHNLKFDYKPILLINGKTASNPINSRLYEVSYQYFFNRFTSLELKFNHFRLQTNDYDIEATNSMVNFSLFPF